MTGFTLPSIASGFAELNAQLDGPRMWKHLEVFDRWAKYSGSPEERESLNYVEAEMRSYGFATTLILHDAYISLPGATSVRIGDETFTCITHSFSRASPKTGLCAPLVYVGAGDEAGFAGKAVHGCIVVVEGIANPGVSRRASRAGAVGQLHISPHQYVHEMCISPVWGNPTHETVAELPATVVVTVPLEAGTRIKSLLAADAGLAATLTAEVDTGWRKTPILVCDMAAADEPFVLYSGHHDTWYYGTMDNGGANATMMEVARLCALRRADWKRGLRVVFWSGHSHGRYSSSSWYAETHWEELERRALVHVNVDSTGGKGNTIVADTTAAAELRAVAREAISQQGGQQFTNRRMGRAGDQSFWGIGVPSIFGNMSEQPASGEANASASVFGGGSRLGHGTGWWWHTPFDTLDKMDEQILVRDTSIYLQTVWRLLTDPVLPFDYAEHAAYLAEELQSLQNAVGERFDLSILTARADALHAKAEQLNRTIAAGREDAARAAIANATLTALAHALVPVDYSTGDRFGQDPAIGQQAYPALQPLRGLPAHPPGSDAALFLEVGMRRARNRVALALREALDAIDEGLARLSE
jgi:N-acetylated-alpha-linked acidic dipeptidase